MGVDGFRAAVQPLVRARVARGASVAAVTRALREAHGRAYRRSDLLAGIRTHRELGPVAPAMAAPSMDLARAIAHAGVAVFAISLLVPTLIYDLTRADVLVAAASEIHEAARADVSLPNQVALLPRRIVAEPTPAPTPTPRPTAPPAVIVPGGPGAVVMASWYGPGFFENRLPCWPWLAASNLPIQFLPDTWGVAHKTLPCGTMVTLSFRGNTVTVPVVDRGPYVDGRELDLSPRVKAALDCTDLCPVLMQIR